MYITHSNGVDLVNARDLRRSWFGFWCCFAHDTQACRAIKRFVVCSGRVSGLLVIYGNAEWGYSNSTRLSSGANGERGGYNRYVQARIEHCKDYRAGSR